jgi:hypothetical protein
METTTEPTTDAQKTNAESVEKSGQTVKDTKAPAKATEAPKAVELNRAGKEREAQIKAMVQDMKNITSEFCMKGDNLKKAFELLDSAAGRLVKAMAENKDEHTIK